MDFGLICYWWLKFGPIILVRFGLMYLLNLVLGLTLFANTWLWLFFFFLVAKSGNRGVALVGAVGGKAWAWAESWWTWFGDKGTILQPKKGRREGRLRRTTLWIFLEKLYLYFFAFFLWEIWHVCGYF